MPRLPLPYFLSFESGYFLSPKSYRPNRRSKTPCNSRTSSARRRCLRQYSRPSPHPPRTGSPTPSFCRGRHHLHVPVPPRERACPRSPRFAPRKYRLLHRSRYLHQRTIRPKDHLVDPPRGYRHRPPHQQPRIWKTQPHHRRYPLHHRSPL